jgi:hypothetical protein
MSVRVFQLVLSFVRIQLDHTHAVVDRSITYIVTENHVSVSMSYLHHLQKHFFFKLAHLMVLLEYFFRLTDF